MLTIKNIDKIRLYTKANVKVHDVDWGYIFEIDNEFGFKPYTVTLSRLHPTQAFHPYRNYYCMTYGNHQMWLQKKDVSDCQKFLIQMTHFMANRI